MQVQRFTATLADGGRGRLLVPVPVDPDAVWGTKPRHPVRGTVDGIPVRGVVTTHADGPGLLLGPAWVRDHPLAPGASVTVDIAPEGPQRDDLADDLAVALAAHPEAARFFDGLAQFYRRAYLRWVDGAARRPALRQERIARMVELLEAGVKDHRQADQTGRAEKADDEDSQARAGSSST